MTQAAQAQNQLKYNQADCDLKNTAVHQIHKYYELVKTPSE